MNLAQIRNIKPHIIRYIQRGFGIALLVVSLFNSAYAQVDRRMQPLQSYNQQMAWQKIERFLPADFHISRNQLPQEQWWSWRGNNIHLDRYRNPRAPIKVILFHGVGTNGRQMSMILAKPLADRNYETIAVDLPGYGLTQVAKNQMIRYQDWVQLGSDLIDAESAQDRRPIVLYGLSAGGMLSYHVAATNKRVKALVGMTFLDTTNTQVRDQVARNILISRLGMPIMHWISGTPLASIRIPMRWVSKMNTLVNQPDVLKIFLADKTSAGNSVSLQFLDSYLNYKPSIQAEDFDTCPILLTQPENDRWTPLYLSTPFLQRINKVPVKIVLLNNAGHFPIEQPGLSQMVEEIDRFYQSVVLQ